MRSGVAKSGSPAPNPITSFPSAFIFFASALTASVADGLTPAAILDSGFIDIPRFHKFMSVVYHNIVKKTTQILHKTPARIYVIFAGLRKNLPYRLPIYIKPQRDTAGNDDDLWLCADGCTHHSDHLSIFLLAVLMHRQLAESPIFRVTGWNFSLFCRSIRNLDTPSTMVKTFCSIVSQISVFY